MKINPYLSLAVCLTIIFAGLIVSMLGLLGVFG